METINIIYQWLVSNVNAQTWAVIVTVCYIVSEILPEIKIVPANGTVRLILNFFKSLILLIAKKGKK